MAIKPGWEFGMARGGEREIGPQVGAGLQPYTRTFQTPAQSAAARGPDYSGLISQVGAQSEAARRANLQRYAQAMAIYDEIIGRTAPGGAFEKAGLAQIETAKTKGVGQETQRMISGGLFGTTIAAGVERGWESEVGAPARLRLEDILERRRTTAQMGKAGFIERREDEYPDINAMLQLIAR